jgi:hypothetical protein
MPPSKQSRTTQPASRSWKEIRQVAPVSSVTDVAKKRKWTQVLKASGSVLGIIVVLVGLTWGVVVLRNSDPLTAFSDNRNPIQRILFESDGTLDEVWLSKQLAIPRGTSLTEIDIFQVKAALESHGQVFSANVERHFPDTLFVKIEERNPTARLAVQGDFGVLETLFVAIDGTVYPGNHYDAAFVRTLPYLDGVKLQARGDGAYQPIRGMDEVAHLFQLARKDYPDLADNWRIVSLKLITPEASPVPASLQIRSRRGPDLIFSVGDYRAQLEKLEVITQDLLRRRGAAGMEQVESIDLSLRGPAVVRFARLAQN